MVLYPCFVVGAQSRVFFKTIPVTPLPNRNRSQLTHKWVCSFSVIQTLLIASFFALASFDATLPHELTLTNIRLTTLLNSANQMFEAG